MRGSHNYKKDLLELSQKNTPRKELTSLAIKTIIIVAGAWITLYLFEIFAAPIVGLKHPHIQSAGTVIIITIAVATIAATRRILRKFSDELHSHLSASVSFFIIILIAFIASIAALYLWNINPQEILLGGGVAAIVVGIGLSVVLGNIFSGALMLTTFPAKIGDSIFIVNDNVRGRIEEITMIYTKVRTDQETEYVVPNNAIIQGNIRIAKDVSASRGLPFSEGDHVEISGPAGTYTGTVIKVVPAFSTILSDDKKKEITFANSTILSTQFIITKDRKT